MGFFTKRKKLIEYLFPHTIKEDLQNAFNMYLQNEQSSYNTFISAYFSYLVLTEGNNSLDKPLELSDYKTVRDLVEARQLVKYSQDPTAVLVSSSKVITWDEALTDFTSTFIEEKFENMFLKPDFKDTALMQKYFHKETPIKEGTAEEVVEHLKGIAGSDYFTSLVTSFKTPVYDSEPEHLYEVGQQYARIRLEAEEQTLTTLEQDFLEVADSVKRLNLLWKKTEVMFKDTFKEELPKGKMGYKLYREKYYLVLLNLRLEKYPVEQVRELILLDTKFEPDVLKAIANFEYL